MDNEFYLALYLLLFHKSCLYICRRCDYIVISSFR